MQSMCPCSRVAGCPGWIFGPKKKKQSCKMIGIASVHNPNGSLMRFEGLQRRRFDFGWDHTFFSFLAPVRINGAFSVRLSGVMIVNLATLTIDDHLAVT